MLKNLQGLRAFAAIGVLAFHFGLMPATQMPFKVGAAGVDIFFTLSGFIIAHSSARSTRHFLAHRLIRVVPTYWIVTVLASVFTLQNLGAGNAFGWLVQSLFYLPGPGGRPVLIFVAWTLIYELAFYLLYWAALHFGKRHAPLVALVLLPAVALIHIPGAPGPWPLLLEFWMGIGIFMLTERLAFLLGARGTSGLAIACAGFALLLVAPRLTGYNPDDYQSIGRVLCWGFPAALIILGLIIAEKGGIAIRNRLVLLLGAASYSIYLLHPMAIGQLIQIAPQTPPVSWTIWALAIGVTVAISVGFHLLVEVPTLRWLRAFFRDPLPIEQRVSTL